MSDFARMMELAMAGDAQAAKEFMGMPTPAAHHGDPHPQHQPEEKKPPAEHRERDKR